MAVDMELITCSCTEDPVQQRYLDLSRLVY